MPHIHTGPGQFDWTVSMFVVRTDGPEPRVLLHRHKTLGLLMQVGGHVELDETPWSAVAHELAEEAGYDLDQVDVLVPPLRPDAVPGNVVHPPPLCVRSVPVAGGVTAPHVHADLAYALVTTEEPRRAPAAGESQELVWLTRDDLQGLPLGSADDDVHVLYGFILDRLMGVWEAVPAAGFPTSAPSRPRAESR